jgi:hypothetical protein
VGLSYDELYDLTPRSFNNKLIGFNSSQEEKVQNEWEQTRIIVHATMSPHSKKKLRPKDILPFPWDNKSKGKKLFSSPEQIAKDVARHRKVLQKLNKQ